MPACSGVWKSTVDGMDDGYLDLNANKHYRADGGVENISSNCPAGKMQIKKVEHAYDGNFVAGVVKGHKRSLKKLKRFDEPTDGEWTAQGPVLIPKGTARKASRKTAATKSSKAKKAAKSSGAKKAPAKRRTAKKAAAKK